LKNNWQNVWSGQGKPVPLQSQNGKALPTDCV